MEFLGLIEAVQFVKGRQVLFWCDKEWRIGSERIMMPARGVPQADTMAEAREVGTAWLASVEAMA